MISLYNLFESATKRGISLLNALYNAHKTRDGIKAPILYHGTGSLDSLKSIQQHGLQAPIRAAGNNINVKREKFNTLERENSSLTKEDHDKTNTILGRYKLDRVGRKINYPTMNDRIGKIRAFRTSKSTPHNDVAQSDEFLNRKNADPDSGDPRHFRKHRYSDHVVFSRNYPVEHYGKQGVLDSEKVINNQYPVSNIGPNRTYHDHSNHPKEYTDEVHSLPKMPMSKTEKIDYPHHPVRSMYYTPSPDKETRDFVHQAKSEGKQLVPLNRRTKAIMSKQFDDSEKEFDEKNKFGNLSFGKAKQYHVRVAEEKLKKFLDES